MVTDYTPEEAEAILTRAAGRKSVDSVSHRRLLDMAEELGISPEEVEAAVQEVLIEQEEKMLRQQFIAERRASFWPHLLTYVLVNAFLLLLNYFTRGHLWAIYSILGWGLGVAIHGASVLTTKGTEFEQEFRVWRRSRERKEKRKTKRASKKATAVTNETPVETETPLQTVTATQEQPQMLRQQSGR